MRGRKLKLIGLLFLAGCGAAAFDPGQAVSGLVKPYSKSFLDRAADELDALPPGSALAVMIADYAVLRQQLRAAQ